VEDELPKKEILMLLPGDDDGIAGKGIQETKQSNNRKE
jgi:hypothetical protein